MKSLDQPGSGQKTKRGGIARGGVGDGRQHNVGPHGSRLHEARVAAEVSAVRRGMAAGGRRGGATVIAGPTKGSGNR